MFMVENGKITLLCTSIVITYYIKLFCTGADRQQLFKISSPSRHRDKNEATSMFKYSITTKEKTLRKNFIWKCSGLFCYP